MRVTRTSCAKPSTAASASSGSPSCLPSGNPGGRSSERSSGYPSASAQVSGPASVTARSQTGWPARILNERGFPHARRVGEDAPLTGRVGEPAGPAAVALASGPWQSPGAGPQVCCLRQLVLEGLGARTIRLKLPLPGGRQAGATFGDQVTHAAQRLPRCVITAGCGYRHAHRRSLPSTGPAVTLTACAGPVLTAHGRPAARGGRVGVRAP
jgi:hypothetical protein